MAKRRFFYDTKPKGKAEWANLANVNQKSEVLDLSCPVRFTDHKIQEKHEAWAQKFSDEWINPVANLGANNAISQYTQWINSRLSYAECAFLANDSIINNAISKIANEMLRKGGKIVLEIDEQERENEIIKALEKRLEKLNFFEILHKAITTTLTYGGALIFIDTNTDKLDEPLYLKKEFVNANKIQHLKVIEPYLCGAVEINSSNPLNADFMIPNKYFVSGGGILDKSRVVPLVFFQSPDMLKPLYNFFGISLCQFMKEYVKTADGARQALADIFLRFRTIIIQSDLPKINAEEAIIRTQVINQTRNNQGTLLLTNDEKYYETITPLTNLDKLIAQMQENIAASARMPAVKLLGLTPSGFNATGDFDLKSYYDEIMSMQNAFLKPVIEKFLRVFVLEMGEDLYPRYEFEKLDNETALNEAQINSLESQTINNLIQGGVITQEQGFNYLQGKKIIDKGEKFDEGEFENDDFSEFENDNLKMQDESDHPRDENGRFEAK